MQPRTGLRRTRKNYGRQFEKCKSSPPSVNIYILNLLNDESSRLEDMVQRNARLSQEPPEPSGSSQADNPGGGSATTGPNKVVTMRRLPDNIDDALSTLYVAYINQITQH
jgi:hypothetical protein